MTLEPQEPIRVAALADLRRLERENDAWQEAIAAQIQAGKAEIAATKVLCSRSSTSNDEPATRPSKRSR